MAKIGIVKIKKLIDALLEFIEEDYLDKTSLKLSLVHTTPNGVGIKKKDTITVTGTRGRAVITFDGFNNIVEFDTNTTISAQNFVIANAAYFLTSGVILTSSTNNIILESSVAGVDFVSPEVSDLKDETFLIRCFDDDDVIEGISYKDLAVEIFTRSIFESRKIDTRLMFDLDRAHLPTVHVREPAKSKGKQDGIGYIDDHIYENIDGSFQEARRRSFDSQYELMITSMNRHEVIIMEEVILGVLIGAMDSLAAQEPFYNISFGVKELMANNDLVPNPLFIKSITLNVGYDKTFPDISNTQLLDKILFVQNILS